MSRGRADVVFVVTSGVTAIFVSPLADELVRRGLTVALVANPGTDAERLAQSFPAGAVHAIAFRRRPSPLHDLIHACRLVVLLARLRPAVVHASTPKAGLLGVIAARITRRPAVVYQARGFRSENTPGVGGRLQRLLERITTKSAHHVIVNSESLRSVMVEAGVLAVDKGIVVGHGGSVGVDTTRFSPSPLPRPGDRSFTIGYVGRLHPDKGLESLLTVLRVIDAHLGDARLLLVGEWEGDHWSDENAERVRSEISSSSRVDIVGFVDDVVPYLHRMDLMVFPSSREGLPNAPLEAQATGLPVVGYRVTGVVDAVVDGVGGMLVSPGHPEELADAVLMLAGDPARRERMGRAGREHVQQRFERRAVIGANADFIEALARRRSD